MRSLAAAISPGLFGFTDWAFATEAPSEIAVQVPIATRKNNALIIISSHIRSFSRMRSICSASSIVASARARQSAASCRHSLTTTRRSMSRARMRCGRWGVKLPGELPGPFASPCLYGVHARFSVSRLPTQRPSSQKASTASLKLASPVEDRSATLFLCLLTVC